MKCRADLATLRTSMVRALSFSAALALTLNPALTPVIAADYRPAAPVAAADGQMNARFLSLGVGKSLVIDLPRDIKDVLVADPKIANAVVRSSQRAYIIGASVGQTNIVFFDSAGQQIAAYDIAVKRDLNGVRAALKQILPNSDIQIDGLGDGVVLSGTAANPVEAQQANDLAVRLAGGADKVVNSIVVRGRDQVMLKVTVAEVARNIVKQLGIDLSANLNYGTSVVSFTNSNPFTAFGRNLVDGNNLTTKFGATPSVQATLRAMETAGVVRTLAEPNLTAISGESATFIAGGEFPVPAGYACDPTTHVCTTQISFKKFGISLNFTPVVLSEGKISLRVMTEVSELSNDNAITLSQAVTSSSVNSLTVPSIKTRRAETSLEIPSGGAMAMAGLIQEQTKQAISGLPGLMQLPILGTLFRSRDFVNNTTELVVIVTPYIVRAAAPKDLSRPDDGFAAPADPQAQLLGNVNRIYGVPGRTEPARTTAALRLYHRLTRNGDIVMITARPQTRYRAAALGGALVGIALALGGCQHDEVATASIPDDYKQRHPIAIEEQNRSIVVFVGHARGGLTAAQRADVMGLASTWMHEGTGAIHIDVPSGTPNARPVAESMREIQAMLAAAGVPPRGIISRPYQPEDKRFLPPIRMTYSKIAAVAGPCGLWPEDLGPSMKNKSWFENKEYYNFGCSYQRNMAAMVDNPSDLEQPRPETPSYTARRITAFEKYRKGTTTTTTYPEAEKAKLSDTGK